MIVDKRNSSISRVGTVVFYKSNYPRYEFKFLPDDIRYIPTELRNFKASLVKYYGSTNNFPGIDFAEYDFSYFPEKIKFDNPLLVGELDSESALLVGRDIEDTDKIGKILFPTLSETNDPSPYEFFGSLLVGGRVLYFFECPENYYEIEIYEDVLDTNVPGSDGFIQYRYLELAGQTSEAIEPSIIITLGPVTSEHPNPREVYNNPTEFYYDQDPLRSRTARPDIEYTALEYSKFCDEIFGKKVVCFFLSPDGSAKDFNIAFSAFQNNTNPLRNKWKYDLRNDEFYKILQPGYGVEWNNTSWVDKKSGTILGNNTIDSSLCPIKNSKLSRLGRTQRDYYSPYRRYMKGDSTIYRVLRSDGTYVSYNVESLCDGNLGNDPLLSPEWILRDKFLDFLTDIIYISQDPAGCGSIVDPGTQITVSTDSLFKFSISDGLGYSFSGVSIIDTQGDKIELTEGTDYSYTLDDTSTEYKKTVSIESWSSFIDPESPKYTKNLVFDFSERPSILKVLVRRGGTIYHYSDWASSLPDFGVEFKINGETAESSIFTDSDLYLFIDSPQTNPTLELEFSGSFEVNGIESNYRIGNKKYKKNIAVTDNTVSGVVDFADSEYIVDLDSIENKVLVKSDRTFIWCDKNGLNSINTGSSFSIPFRVLEPGQYTFKITVINFRYDENGRMIKLENDLIIRSCPFTDNLELDGTTTADIELTIEEGYYLLVLSNITENIFVDISGELKIQ